MEDEESPSQSKTFVVITLPPPDNPSYGKTISTFTIPNPYSSSSSSPIQPQDQPPHQNPQTPPLILEQDRLSLGNLHLGARITLLLLLGISLFALILWACPSPQTLFQTKGFGDHRGSNGEDNDGEDDGKVRSFMFPLYPKMGVGGMSKKDIELKLGRFVEFDSDKAVSRFVDDGMSESKIIKAVSTVESTAILPVKGGIYPDGLYYTYILVGTPPRPYFLDVDTGSDLAWVQCDAPCTSCAKGAHPLYKPNKVNLLPSKDSLCAEVQKTHASGHCETCHQCDYEIEYADHSSSMGVLARDDLHLKTSNGSLSKSKVVFGCAYDQQGIVLNSLTKTDGILGLSSGKVSLPSQLASQGVINNVIGHCLTADVGGGGYMFLGDDFVPHRQMKWIPMLNLPATNSYVAETSKISYANKGLSRPDGLQNGHVVFDSGSSYTYFTKHAYADLVASLQDLAAAGLIQDASDNTMPICWKAKVPIRSIHEVKKFFMPLTFQFGRKWLSLPVKLQIPPEGYLVISNKGNVCLGILDGSEIHDGSSIILGDISLRGQLVVYDNVNHLIGWMPSDCVKPQNLDLPPSL